MNFKLKALVAAAVATVTMSGAANALTNNEMFLVAYDSVAAKTFVAALGVAGSASAFTGTTSLSVNYATDTNWTSFMSGATASNITYQVLGFYSADTASAGSYVAGDKILTSSNNSQPLPNLVNDSFNMLMNDMVSTTGINGGFQFLNSAVTGNATALVTGAAENSGAAVGINLFGQYPGAFDATAGLDTNVNFYNIGRNVSDGDLAKSVITQYVQGTTVGAAADVWNLSSAGVLSYTAVAAVPETDSLSMALLGMGLMGFVARRRRNTNV